MPLWAALLAVAFALLRGRRHAWRAYYWVVLLAWFVHILGDLITSYGTQILSPFSDWAPGLNTTFIIDPWFSGLLLAGLVLSLWWRPRTGAVLGLAAAVALVGFQATQYRTAVDLGERWAAQQGFDAATVQAYPQPWSPRNWMVIVERPEVYHLARVNLGRTRAPAEPDPDAFFLHRLWAAYPPVAEGRWARFTRYGPAPVDATARALMGHPEFGFFRWFAAHPALHHAGPVDDGGAYCVVFEDLRFRLPALNPPFRYGFCRADGAWHRYRFSGDLDRAPL